MLCLIFILNFGYLEKKKYEMLLLVKREMEFKGRQKIFILIFSFLFFLLSIFQINQKKKIEKQKTKKAFTKIKIILKN